MIHKHATMRDLLRNPSNTLPKAGEELVVSRNGFPSFVVSPIDNVSFNFMSSDLSGSGVLRSASLPPSAVIQQKTEKLIRKELKKSEGVSIHEHKKN